MSSPGPAPLHPPLPAGFPEPLDLAEYRAELAGADATKGADATVILPGPVQVRPGIWVLPQPMPAEYPPHFTLSYLVHDTDGALHLIDPGWDSDENHERLARLFAQIGASLGDLATILVTHLHPDHIGMADRLRRESGALIALHRLEQEALLERVRSAGPAPDAAAGRATPFAEWGVPPERIGELDAVAARLNGDSAASTPPVRADLLLEDDQLIDLPGHPLRVLLTPGHTRGHVCLVHERQRIVFTGDTLLPAMFPGIGLGGPAADPIGDYLRSLELLEGYGGYEVFPGHGYRFADPVGRIETTRRHHLRRSDEIAAIVREHPDAPVWQIASEVTWTAGWHNLSGFYLFSALAQTAMHVQYLRASAG